MRKLYLLIVLFASHSLLFAQQRTVEGVVTDTDNMPLPGVNVLVKNSTSGTVTDVNGQYRLSISNEVQTLVFSYVGYQTQEVTLGNHTEVNVQMTPDIEALQEVVVVVRLPGHRCVCTF